MRRPNLLLIAGIAISAVVHGAFIETLIAINSSETARRLFKQSTFVPIEVKRPEPPPPPPKPKPRPQPKPVTPPPNTEKPSPPPEEEVKPVFGVTKETVANADTGIGVRVGNTLMKEMEKDYTPPEEVKELPKVEKRPPEPRFAPVAAFKLARMPEIKEKVRPEYPRELRADGVEGEVLLRVSVDRTGKVVAVIVVASDHELFAKAAMAAVRSWRFAPARLASGEEADAVIEIPVIFQLDF